MFSSSQLPSGCCLERSSAMPSVSRGSGASPARHQRRAPVAGPRSAQTPRPTGPSHSPKWLLKADEVKTNKVHGHATGFTISLTVDICLRRACRPPPNSRLCRRYGPACPGCVACEPIRLDLLRFTPSRSQRRTLLRGDQQLTVELGEPIADAVAKLDYQRTTPTVTISLWRFCDGIKSPLHG